MTRAGLGQAEEKEVLFFLSEGNIMVSGIHSFPLPFFLWLTLACYSNPVQESSPHGSFSALHAYSYNQRPLVGGPSYSVSITLRVFISLSLRYVFPNGL